MGIRILLVSRKEGAMQLRAMLDALLPTWPESEPPEIEWMDASEFIEISESDLADVAWVYGDPEFNISDLQTVLDQAEILHLGTLVTSDEITKPLGSCWMERFLVVPRNSDPTHVSLMIQSLASQAPAFEQLGQELEIAQRYQRGLVSQAEKFDAEMQLATRMQKLFIPKSLPKVPGVVFSVMYQPASYVSGDIYDVQLVGDRYISFFVADAVGHGMPAALMTMYIKQGLVLKEQTDAGEIPVLPDQALTHLNADIMARDLDTFNYGTVVCGLYNIQTRQLQLAHSIHPPPFLMRQNGEIKAIELEGPMLGVTEDDPFELTTLTLEVGDRLVLYSDGFELAFGNPNEPMNPEYVKELEALRNGTQSEALIELKQKIDRQVGSLNQHDDLTAMLMDITA